MRTSTYLNFNGNCKEAMTFYADVLGGDITMLIQFKEAPNEVYKNLTKEQQDLTMHCTLEVGDFAIQASDFFSEKETFKAGNNFSVSLNFDDEDEAMTIFNGLLENGTIITPLHEIFTGGKVAILKDKFGIQWMIVLEE